MTLLVHEVAERVGIHVETVRRLERRGVIRASRDCNGWRRFEPEVVETLKRLYLKDLEIPGQAAVAGGLGR